MSSYANRKQCVKALRRAGYTLSQVDVIQGDDDRWTYAVKADAELNLSDELPEVDVSDEAPAEEQAQAQDAPADEWEEFAPTPEPDPLEIPAHLRRSADPQPTPEPEPEALADEPQEIPPPIPFSTYAKLAAERRGQPGREKRGPVLAELRRGSEPEKLAKEKSARAPFRQGSRGAQLIDLAKREEGVTVAEMKALGLKDPTTQLRDTAKRLGLKHRSTRGTTQDETRYWVFAEAETPAQPEPVSEIVEAAE